MITDSFNESKPCLRIFIDLSKALDTVNHQLLLQSLKDIGTRNNELKLFDHYRLQRVRVDDVLNNIRTIK